MNIGGDGDLGSSRLANGPWLIFATYGQDAALGIGGAILLAVRRGITVTLVILTDRESPLDRESTPLEDRQSVAAAAIHLGIPHVYAWNCPPQQLGASQYASERIAAVLNRTQSRCVFLPSSFDADPARRIASTMIWEGIKSSRNLDPAVCSYEVSSPCPTNCLVDISVVVRQKKALLDVFDRAGSSVRDAELMDALARARAYTLPPEATHAEALYVFDSLGGTPTTEILAGIVIAEMRPDAATTAPLVSVLVRTKNRPASLQDALKSISRQSHRPLEVVVGNDGGQDVSAIVRGFGESSGIGVHYLDLQPSVGRSKVANACLGQATGEYLIFLDDDDWFDSPHIENLVRRLEREPNLIACYSGTRCLQADTAGSLQTVKIYNDDFDAIRIIRENFIPVHAVLFRRKAIVENPQCRFDKELEHFEDWDFWLQLLNHGLFAHDARITANYFIQPKTRDPESDRRLEHLCREHVIKKQLSRWSVPQISDLFSHVDTLEARLRAGAAERGSLVEQCNQLERRVRQLEQLLFSGAPQRVWALHGLAAFEEAAKVAGR